MSDGNYNRNLLPYRNYQSGLRAGRAQTIARASSILSELLADSPLTAEQRQDLLQTFRQRVSEEP